MRIVLKRQALDTEGLVFRVLLPVVLVLALGLTTFAPSAIVPACTFKTWTGMPCGGCGTFRGLSLLAQGNIAAALSMQPLIIGICLVALLYAVYAGLAVLFRWPHVNLTNWTVRDTAWTLSLAVLAYFANWGYLILDGR